MFYCIFLYFFSIINVYCKPNVLTPDHIEEYLQNKTLEDVYKLSQHFHRAAYLESQTELSDSGQPNLVLADGAILPCDPNWYQYSGNNCCYRKTDAMSAWYGGTGLCKALHPEAQMASFHSQAESEFVCKKYSSIHAWTGLSQTGTPGVWTYTDGTPDWHWFFAQSSTMTPESSCVEMMDGILVLLFSWSAKKGQTQPYSCTEEIASICKYCPKETTTTSTSTTTTTTKTTTTPSTTTTTPTTTTTKPTTTTTTETTSTPTTTTETTTTPTTTTETTTTETTTTSTTPTTTTTTETTTTPTTATETTTETTTTPTTTTETNTTSTLTTTTGTTTTPTTTPTTTTEKTTTATITKSTDTETTTTEANTSPITTTETTTTPTTATTVQATTSTTPITTTEATGTSTTTTTTNPSITTETSTTDSNAIPTITTTTPSTTTSTQSTTKTTTKPTTTLTTTKTKNKSTVAETTTGKTKTTTTSATPSTSPKPISCSSKCQRPLVEFNGYCYKMCRGSVKFGNSCELCGGTVVTVSNKEVNDFISRAFGANDGTTTQIWVGNTETSGYLNWADGQPSKPNDGLDYCISMDLSAGPTRGKYRYLPCQNTLVSSVCLS